MSKKLITKQEQSQVVTNCDRLKLLAQDGKMRLADVADVQELEQTPHKKIVDKTTF